MAAEARRPAVVAWVVAWGPRRAQEKAGLERNQRAVQALESGLEPAQERPPLAERAPATARGRVVFPASPFRAEVTAAAAAVAATVRVGAVGELAFRCNA